MKGKYIVVEGGEGAGKTTIARFVKEKLEKLGLKVLLTREPGGTKVAERLREIILKNKLDPLTETFLFLTARSEIMENIVSPALKEGKIVISDRTFPSTLIYQGIVKKVGVEKTSQLNKIAMGDIRPNLVIILDVDAKSGLERNAKIGDVTKFDKEGLAFNKKINQGYRSLARRFGWKVVDANQPLEKVKNQVWRLVFRLIKRCRKVLRDTRNIY